MEFLDVRFCSIYPHEPGIKGFWFHLCDLAQSHLWHFLDFVLRRTVPKPHRPQFSWKCVTSAFFNQLHDVTSSGGDADHCCLLAGRSCVVLPRLHSTDVHVCWVGGLNGVLG